MKASQIKRAVYLLHRWAGIAGCLLLLAWFVSGAIMLFVGYPKMLPGERLAKLPPLAGRDCCVPVDTLAGWRTAERIVLSAAGGGLRYHLHTGGDIHVYDAATGAPLGPADASAARRAAGLWLPGARAVRQDIVREDSWTHSGGLDVHRPLHRLLMDDASGTLLYVSSRTGEVVLAATRSQRLWNYTGAWLHWLYVLRRQSSDPVWDGAVIALSALGMAVALSGTLVGIWRWRFAGRYRHGSRSPYREGWMRWHHIVGLACAGFTCTWTFSGLMSMNPGGAFDARGHAPNLAAYAGPAPAALPASLSGQAVLARLGDFGAVQLQWLRLAGRPYVLAHNARNDTMLALDGGSAAAALQTRFGEQELLQAAAGLLPAPLASHRWLYRYDSYYYAREPQAMRGASQRRLPALRLQYADAAGTWVHIDAATGQVENSMDSRQRLGRWLFDFLHSWDAQALLRRPGLRDAVLLVLNLAGAVLAVTGLVLAWRRLRPAGR